MQIITSKRYLAINKPYLLLSQFSNEGNMFGLSSILAEYNLNKDVYPIGRLDSDSEGLLLLSNDKTITDLLLNPQRLHKRTYYVQVDGTPTDEQISSLNQPIILNIKGKLHTTAPAHCILIDEPSWLWQRTPPIRYRKDKPTSWLSITLTEGKNRQVRKMTASCGLPTLRLIRYSIEDLNIQMLNGALLKEFSKDDFFKLLKLKRPLN